MILIVKDKSFYLAEMIMSINKFHNLKKKKYNLVKYSQIILGKVQILVNKLRITKKLMMKIGQAKKKMQKKIRKVKNKKKEMMRVPILQMNK